MNFNKKIKIIKQAGLGKNLLHLALGAGVWGGLNYALSSQQARDLIGERLAEIGRRATKNAITTPIIHEAATSAINQALEPIKNELNKKTRSIIGDTLKMYAAQDLGGMAGSALTKILFDESEPIGGGPVRRGLLPYEWQNKIKSISKEFGPDVFANVLGRIAGIGIAQNIDNNIINKALQVYGGAELGRPIGGLASAVKGVMRVAPSSSNRQMQLHDWTNAIAEGIKEYGQGEPYGRAIGALLGLTVR